MTQPGRTDDAGRFSIDQLVDQDARARQSTSGYGQRTTAGRPVRRDLHWWAGGAMLAIALPMLLWQARAQQDGTEASRLASGPAGRAGPQVRPPETIGALERTIEEQARLAQSPAMPPLPPLPPGAVGPAGLQGSLPQRSGDAVPAERRRHEHLAAALPVSDPAPSRAERLAVEQERRDADARSSPLLAIGQGGGVSVPAVSLSAPFAAPPPERNPSTAVRALGVSDSTVGSALESVSAPAPAPATGAAPALRPAPGGPAVLEGTVIPAVLLTEINSELPGTLVALVAQDIWDSVEGRHLLIPKGSRLVGDYNSDVRPGQERVLAAFRRLVFPNGSSLDLLGTQATDAQGRSGLHDRVDRHFWTMFGASFIVAGLASLVQRQEAQPSTVIVVPGSSPGASSALASAAGSVLVDTSRAILGRTRNIPPTVLIRQGHRFSLTVQRHFLLNPADTGRMADVSR
jgi:type IV secretion system protein VirB10